jgi:NTP pyrophosphatase (non-canonical NTP hydrolase)
MVRSAVQAFREGEIVENIESCTTRTPSQSEITMLTLPPNPTLANLQIYVRDMEVERSFDDQTIIHKCLLLGEEIGELFKAIRKSDGLKVDSSSRIGAADEELADVLIYLCSIANRLGVDLEQAFRQKEAINHKRTWIKHPESGT